MSVGALWLCLPLLGSVICKAAGDAGSRWTQRRDPARHGRVALGLGLLGDGTAWTQPSGGAQTEVSGDTGAEMRRGVLPGRRCAQRAGEAARAGGRGGRESRRGCGGAHRACGRFSPFKRKTMPGIREAVSAVRVARTCPAPGPRSRGRAGAAPPAPGPPPSTGRPRLSSSPGSRPGGAALGLFWASPCSEPRLDGLSGAAGGGGGCGGASREETPAQRARPP